MSDLKDYDVKIKAIRFDKDGYSQSKIAELLGIPRSTLGDFLRKESFVSFWADYDSQEKMVPTTDSTPDFEKILTEFKYPIITSNIEKDDCKHFFIPDTQVKPGIDLSWLSWVGQYMVERKPDVIVHIGDNWDFPSLSSYDKGKKAAEGKRVAKDINAGIKGMEVLLKPLYDYQQKELEEYGEIRYKPRMILTLGNHEERLMRHVEANPELHGFLSYDNLLAQDMGWEVYDYLKPIVVNGITYCHFMANPMSGKPYGGAALNILRHVGESYSMGHKQTLDVATRFLPASGKQQWGIIAGACYLHEEAYKGHQGNHHWRGVIVKHNVSNGSYNPMFVDLDYLRKKYNA